MTKIRALLFDVNGTLIDIETDEWMEEAYRAIAHFLTYQGIRLRRGEVRDLYFQIMKEQFAASTEKYPEFDVVAVWRELLRRHATDYTRSLSAEKLQQMPLFLAEMQRGISRKRLVAFPQTQEILAQLKTALLPGGGFRCAERLRRTGASARRPGRLLRAHRHLRRLRLSQARPAAFSSGPEQTGDRSGRGDFHRKRPLPRRSWERGRWG
jgi:FMN phosphatase YigB (HAD superfamily)